jgi:hypothetical protein
MEQHLTSHPKHEKIKERKHKKTLKMGEKLIPS